MHLLACEISNVETADPLLADRNFLKVRRSYLAASGRGVGNVACCKRIRLQDGQHTSPPAPSQGSCDLFAGKPSFNKMNFVKEKIHLTPETFAPMV